MQFKSRKRRTWGCRRFPDGPEPAVRASLTCLDYSRHRCTRREHTTRTIHLHEMIFQAVQQRDVEGSRRAMKLHLEIGYKTYLAGESDDVSTPNRNTQQVSESNSTEGGGS